MSDLPATPARMVSGKAGLCYRAGGKASIVTLIPAFALAGVLAGCGALAVRHYRSLPEAHDAARADNILQTWPRVSIIVPARNEEHNLPTLLHSLTALDYPDYEVIVVDDASTDGTGAIAAEFAASFPERVHMVRGTGPTPGWTGKNAACFLGTHQANGEWLLFTDADTNHTPGSLRAAMSMAKAARVRALSFFTRQRCITFWERLLLPFAYQQYFVGVQPAALWAATGPALANGQYFLIARAAYEAVGGHGAVAGNIIDDVALACVLKRSGHPPLPCRGETFVSVRMYAGLGALVEGFTKNSFQFLQEQRATGALVVLSTASATAVLTTLIGAIRSGDPLPIAAACLAYGALALGLAPWERTFGVPLRYVLLGPVAALAFTLIALSSALHALTHRPVHWKGRAYQTDGKAK